MKKTIVVTILLTILCILFFREGATLLRFREYYREAEPLVQTVWPLAHEMERYVSVSGVYPEDLDDLASFSNELDLSALEPYDAAFYTADGLAFFLEVNDRYAFAISRDFVPSWVDVRP